LKGNILPHAPDFVVIGAVCYYPTRQGVQFFDSLTIYREEVTKMESMILLECLKLIWLGFEIVKHFISRKREKAMIDALENLNHRLVQLEEKSKEIP
jgi:hypothetical protein